MIDEGIGVEDLFLAKYRELYWECEVTTRDYCARVRVRNSKMRAKCLNIIRFINYGIDIR